MSDDKITCPVSGYTWKKRVANPKSCARCKVRLDIPRTKQEPKMERGEESICV